MSYKWKPSASQRRAFAEKMQDPKEKEAYEIRKREKKYYENWKDKDFVPTKEQNDFCFAHMDLFTTPEERDAANMVISGYSCQEKTNHAFIHIVNEKRRNN
jgi:hypothetical protein